jgi:aminopeptidase-like protein
MGVILEKHRFWCATCNFEWLQGEGVLCICSPNDYWKWIIYHESKNELEFISREHFRSCLNLSSVVFDVLPSWMKYSNVG